MILRQGVDIPYSTLHRFAVVELGFGRKTVTVPVVDGKPGEELRVDLFILEGLAIGGGLRPGSSAEAGASGKFESALKSAQPFFELRLRESALLKESSDRRLSRAFEKRKETCGTLPQRNFADIARRTRNRFDTGALRAEELVGRSRCVSLGLMTHPSE